MQKQSFQTRARGRNWEVYDQNSYYVVAVFNTKEKAWKKCRELNA